MNSFFTDLQVEADKQRALLAQPKGSNAKPVEDKSPVSPSEQKIAQSVEQIDAQLPAQTSKQVSKPVSKDTETALSSERVETLAFRLRKEPKVKVNAEVPLAWKTRLDDLAHQMQVGKYDLVMYIIAEFLGEMGE